MNSELPACPKCNGHDFKVWKLPNFMLLHWVINPGLAFNELILGQRIPREMLECRTCDLPRMERTFVRCPSCHTVHDSRVWRGRYGFGNWLGYVCPSCGERIPCLWNFTSLAILTLTAPLWYFPVRYYRRHAIPSRPPLTPPPAMKDPGLRTGLIFGGLMFAFMSLVPVTLNWIGTQRLNWSDLGSGAVICSVAGLAFGWFMSKY